MKTVQTPIANGKSWSICASYGKMSKLIARFSVNYPKGNNEGKYNYTNPQQPKKGTDSAFNGFYIYRKIGHGWCSLVTAKNVTSMVLTRVDFIFIHEHRPLLLTMKYPPLGVF